MVKLIWGLCWNKIVKEVRKSINVNMESNDKCAKTSPEQFELKLQETCHHTLFMV